MQKLSTVQKRLRKFAEERDWEKFHSPKNIAMALSVEASELLECFQWLTEKESHELSQEQIAAVTDEIADVQLYLLLLADVLNVDVCTAIDQKIAKNEERYPADKVRGSARKYTDYK